MTQNERTILVVDDEKDILSMIEDMLAQAGYAAKTESNPLEALELLRTMQPDLVISDLMMAGMNGLEFVEKAREIAPGIDTAIITGHSSTESAIRALRMGVFDYLTKPFDYDELVALVDRVFAYRELASENTRLRSQLAIVGGESPLVVGSSAAMQNIMNIIKAVAPMPTSVLIRGESGTGKELIANELHRLSPRSNGPLIKVNCAALPENLLEDELFGHEKGAFTGAVSQRIGRFEEANGGTIFLDEIAEMNPLLQAKILRVLQERTFQRVGSNQTMETDVRVICATNKDLEKAVAEGQFREDLYYRINVVQVSMPPLRERPEDIPALTEALTHRISLRLGLPVKTFSPDALEALQTMAFPGNVRELQNLLERVLIFSRTPQIDAKTIQQILDGKEVAPVTTAPSTPTKSATSEITLNGTLEDIERSAIQRALEFTGGNMYQAAKKLGISRSTLYSKVKKLNMSKDDSQSEETPENK